MTLKDDETRPRRGGRGDRAEREERPERGDRPERERGARRRNRLAEMGRSEEANTTIEASSGTGQGFTFSAGDDVPEGPRSGLGSPEVVAGPGMLASTGPAASETESRRAKIIALTRATLRPLTGGSAAVPAPLGPPQEIGRPRLIVGAVPKSGGIGWTTWSAILAIALPTLIAAIYYMFIASDQYFSEGRFAVRTNEAAMATSTTGVMASLGLGSSTPTIADSYIVVDFLTSRQLVEEMQKKLDIRMMFSRPGVDWYARLDPTVSVEDLVIYWKSMTHPYFDSMTGIVTFSVKAFTREDAQKIATAALESAEKLINDLSVRSREDTLQFAKDDLSRAELRLRFARKAIREFRDRQKQIDPTALAAARMSILSGLESQLAESEAERATVNTFLNATAPSVIMMENKMQALRKRIAEERSKLGSTEAQPGKEVMSTVFSEFEELETDREFAEELYKSTLESLEAARMASERKLRYVASFVAPNLPEKAEYPQRFKDIIVVFLVCSIAWVIGILLVYGIRDHTV